jgi:branched-subunit amino acid aminotransferase/4-amino-4-deoxychorismate lyase
MVVKGDALVTPPTPGVLPGVTRAIVLDVAQATRLKTQERRLVVDDLHEAEEVLLTSSLREVYGASELDGRPLRTGSHAQRLREAFGERVREILGGRSGPLS